MNDSTTTDASTSPEGTSPTLEHLDPTTLLIDHNVRSDATPDKALIDSVRDLGVLVPLSAVRTEDGVRVRYGHRRTRAAIEAGRPTVPVWVFDADSAGGDVERIVRQWAENEHRTSLTEADRLAAVEQMSAFGISAAQISKRLRAPRKHVDAALAASGSTLAKAAVVRYDFLDLTQAAVIAEFDADGDSDTVKALIAAAKTSPGQFEHVAQRARDEREAQAREQDARDTIAASGVTLLEGRAPSRYGTPQGNERLVTDLTDSDAQVLTPAAHAACPGHAAYLAVEHGYWTPEQAATVRLGDTLDAPDDTESDDPDDLDDDERDPDDDDGATWGARYAAAYVCRDFQAHGHTLRFAGYDNGHASHTTPATEADAEAQKEAARAERRRVIENNKAWTSAEAVRRRFVRSLLTRKTAPKGAATFLALSLVEGNYAVRRAMEGQHTDLADLLGLQFEGAPGTTTLSRPRVTTVLDGVSDNRAQVIALGVVLAAYETATGKHSWRNTDSGTARYLRFLADHGYTLADVEHLACGQTPQSAHETDSDTDSGTGEEADAA